MSDVRLQQPVAGRIATAASASQATRGHAAAVSLHVLPTAATMIGVCMTVISIVKLTPAGPFRHFADRLLGIDGTVFLISVALSYGALRSPRLARALERWADYAFLSGLVMMAIVGLIVAFEIL